MSSARCDPPATRSTTRDISHQYRTPGDLRPRPPDPAGAGLGQTASVRVLPAEAADGSAPRCIRAWSAPMQYFDRMACIGAVVLSAAALAGCYPPPPTYPVTAVPPAPAEPYPPAVALAPNPAAAPAPYVASPSFPSAL